MCTYIYTCLHVYMCMYIYIYVYVYIYTHVYMCICVCIYIYRVNPQAHGRAHRASCKTISCSYELKTPRLIVGGGLS